MILENENTIRKFENTDYFGYLFHVSYDGLMFDSFDENPDMISVKSKFRELLESNNIKFYKGIMVGVIYYQSFYQIKFVAVFLCKGRSVWVFSIFSGLYNILRVD